MFNDSKDILNTVKGFETFENEKKHYHQKIKVNIKMQNIRI